MLPIKMHVCKLYVSRRAKKTLFPEELEPNPNIGENEYDNEYDFRFI